MDSIQKTQETGISFIMVVTAMVNVVSLVKTIESTGANTFLKVMKKARIDLKSKRRKH